MQCARLQGNLPAKKVNHPDFDHFIKISKVGPYEKTVGKVPGVYAQTICRHIQFTLYLVALENFGFFFFSIFSKVAKEILGGNLFSKMGISHQTKGF